MLFGKKHVYLVRCEKCGWSKEINANNYNDALKQAETMHDSNYAHEPKFSITILAEKSEKYF